MESAIRYQGVALGKRDLGYSVILSVNKGIQALGQSVGRIAPRVSRSKALSVESPNLTEGELET